MTSIFAGRGGKRQTMSTQASGVNDFQVTTENELRAAIGAVVAAGTGYGRSINNVGSITLASRITFPDACKGLRWTGAGIIIAAEVSGSLITVDNATDFTIDGVSIKVPATAVTQTIINSTGLRTNIRNLKIVGNSASLATVSGISVTRQTQIINCSVAVGTAGAAGTGILVNGVISGSTVIGNDLLGNTISTSGGTYSTVVGNRNVSASSAYNVLDAVGLNT